MFIKKVYFCLFILLCGSSQLYAAAQNCSRENLQKLETANNLLALNIYNSISADSTKNVFFSPLSISIVFGMLFKGTGGATAKELRQALGYNEAELPDDAVHSSFKCLLSQLTHDSSYILNIPNQIILDPHLRIHPEYIKSIRNFYNSTVKNVNFENQEQLVEMVNSWVRRNTNGKIERLLDDAEEVPETSGMILLNAVYFEGKWEKPFNPKETRERYFNNWMSDANRVPMMRANTPLPYYSEKEFQALELPYEGNNNNISMLILLPRQDVDFETFENSITYQKLTSIRKNLKKQRILVHIPKFSLEESQELSSIIYGLGARKIFHGHANFSGMSQNTNIVVSKIQHKAFIEVDEEGSKAAAATMVELMFRSMTRVEFVADRPFVFSIIWNNFILFMGRLTEM